MKDKVSELYKSNIKHYTNIFKITFGPEGKNHIDVTIAELWDPII